MWVRKYLYRTDDVTIVSKVENTDTGIVRDCVITEDLQWNPLTGVNDWEEAQKLGI